MNFLTKFWKPNAFAPTSKFFRSRSGIVGLIILLVVLLVFAVAFHDRVWKAVIAVAGVSRAAFGFWRSHLTLFSAAKDLLLSVVIILVVSPLIVGLAIFLGRELTRHILVIDPFSVPKQYGDLGLTGEVFASRVKYELLELLRIAYTKTQEQQHDLSQEQHLSQEQPDNLLTKGVGSNETVKNLMLTKEAELNFDLELPGTKVGLKTILEVFRALFDKYPTRVSGDIVLSVGSALVSNQLTASITIRINRNNRTGETVHTTASANDFEETLRNSAEIILRNIDPFRLGAYYSRNGNEPAAKTIWEAIADDPSSTRKRKALANNALGVILNLRGRPGDAIRKYRRATEGDPTFSLPHYNWGNVLRDQYMFDEAIEKYQKAIELDPKFAAAYNSWGIALQKVGKPDEAIGKYQKAIELDPKFAFPHNNWGNVLRNRGKFDEAIEKYQKAIELDPKSALAPGNWGLALQELGKLDEAIEKYQMAIELDPKIAFPHNNWGHILHEQGKFDEAIEKYQKAIELDPKFVLPHNNWGNVLRDQGKFDEAIEKYQKAIELDPHFVLPHYNWGNVLRDQGKFDEAIEKYQKAIELDPTFAAAYDSWGIALQELGKPDEAIEKFQKAIELDAKWARVYNNRGVILREKGRPDPAIVDS